MMFPLGQSLLSLRRLILAGMLAALFGCDSANERLRTSTAKPGDPLTCLAQGEDDLADNLLMQSSRAGVAEEKFAAETGRAGAEAAATGNWGAAMKGYGASVLCMPTVDALIGYAHATAMLDTPRPDANEAMDAKIRTFRAAISRYRLALEFDDRMGQSMPIDLRQDVTAKIQCLEAFVSAPDAAMVACPLVDAALRGSRIAASVQPVNRPR